MTTFNFDSDTPGQPPKGFQFGLTGKGRPGKWIVQTAEDAPSGKNVLAQTDGDEYTPPPVPGWNSSTCSRSARRRARR